MQISGNVATLANRYRNPAILVVALGLVAAFLYVFNFTTFFGGTVLTQQ